jgi:hypothetical protein
MRFNIVTSKSETLMDPMNAVDARDRRSTPRRPSGGYFEDLLRVPEAIAERQRRWWRRPHARPSDENWLNRPSRGPASPIRPLTQISARDGEGAVDHRVERGDTLPPATIIERVHAPHESFRFARNEIVIHAFGTIRS